MIATNLLFTEEHPLMQLFTESFKVNIFQPGADDCCIILLGPIVEVSALENLTLPSAVAAETEQDTGGTSCWFPAP